MNIRVDKNYHGYTSVRDYIVDGCISRNESLIINHKGEDMTVPVERLRTAKQLHTRPMQSKYKPGQVYELVDFKFISDKNEAAQMKLGF
jgi:hypothetical protein